MDAINYPSPNPHILLISIIKEALVVRLYHEVDVMLCSYMIMWLFSIIVSIHNLLYMNYNIGMGAMGGQVYLLKTMVRKTVTSATKIYKNNFGAIDVSSYYTD